VLVERQCEADDTCRAHETSDVLARAKQRNAVFRGVERADVEDEAAALRRMSHDRNRCALCLDE